MAIPLIDSRTGQLYDAPDEAGAEAQIRAFGLTRALPEQVDAYDLQRRQGGPGAQLATVQETARATAAKMFAGGTELAGSAIQGLTGFGTAQGLERESAPVTGATLDPGSSTVEAKERRAANPKAAFVGAALPDLALQALLPGSGLAAMGARAVAGGAAAAAGESVITGDEFSLSNMALYGATGGVLEGVSHLALGAAMRAVGKTRSVIDELVGRARAAALSDAAAEADPLLRSQALRENAAEFYELHQVKLDEALGTIGERMESGPERMFSPSALKKSVSENATAQGEHYLELAVQLRQAADVTSDPTLEAATQLLQDGLEGTGAKMYGALRAARKTLGDALPDSPLAREALQALDDSLHDQSIWGRAAKNHADFAGVAAEAVPAGFKIDDEAQREALDAWIGKARQQASLTGDKKLRKAIEQAEKALAGADEVTGARVMGPHAAAARRDAAADAAAGAVDDPAQKVRGKTVDRLRREAGYKPPDEPKLGALDVIGKAKKFGNDLAEYELDNFVQTGLKSIGATAGHTVGGIPGGIAGYLVGRWLHIRFGDQITRFVWKSAKRALLNQAAHAPVKTAATVAGAAIGGVLAGVPGAVGGAAAVRAGIASAAEKAEQVAAATQKLGDRWSLRLWKQARQAAKDHGGQALGTAAIVGASALAQEGKDETGRTTEGSAPLAASAGLIGLLSFFLPAGGRRQLVEELGEALHGLSARERMSLRMATERAAVANEDLLRKFARGEISGTPEDLIARQYENIALAYQHAHGLPAEAAWEHASDGVKDAIHADTYARNAAIVEHDEELRALAQARGAPPALYSRQGGGQAVQGSPELRRMGLPEPGETALREMTPGDRPLSVEGEAPTSPALQAARTEGRWRAAEDSYVEGDMPERAARDWNRRMTLIQGATGEQISRATADDLTNAARGMLHGWESDFRQAIGSPPSARASEYAEASFHGAMVRRQQELARVEAALGRSSPLGQLIEGHRNQMQTNTGYREAVERARGEGSRPSTVRNARNEEMEIGPEALARAESALQPGDMPTRANDSLAVYVDDLRNEITPRSTQEDAHGIAYWALGRWKVDFQRLTSRVPNAREYAYAEHKLLALADERVTTLGLGAAGPQRGDAASVAARRAQSAEARATAAQRASMPASAAERDARAGSRGPETSAQQRDRAAEEAFQGLEGRSLPTEAAVAVTTGVDSLRRQIDRPMGEGELMNLVGSEVTWWSRQFRENVGREATAAEQEYARAVFMQRAGEALETEMNRGRRPFAAQAPPEPGATPSAESPPSLLEQFPTRAEAAARVEARRAARRAAMAADIEAANPDFRLTAQNTAHEPAIVHGLERGLATRLDTELDTDLASLARGLEDIAESGEEVLAAQRWPEIRDRARAFGRENPSVGEDAAEEFAKVRFDEQIKAQKANFDDQMDEAAKVLARDGVTYDDLDAEQLLTALRDDFPTMSPADENAIRARYAAREDEFKTIMERASMDTDDLVQRAREAAHDLGRFGNELDMDDLYREMRDRTGTRVTDAEQEFLQEHYHNTQDFEESHAEGVQARHEEFDDSEVRGESESAAEEMGNDGESLNFRDLVDRTESRLGRELDEQERDYVSNRYHNTNEYEEYHSQGDDNQSHSDDNSDDDTPLRARSGEYNAGGRRNPNVEDGLPLQAALERSGLDSVHMIDPGGVANVFGDEPLTMRDCDQMFALEEIKGYAASVGKDIPTKLVVTSTGVSFSAEGADVDLSMDFTRTSGGIRVYAGRMFFPRDAQGQGLSKKIIRSAFPGFERRGAKKVECSAAEIGRYAWLALGFRPDLEAEEAAKQAYMSFLRHVSSPEATAAAVARINHTRDLADSTIPLDSISAQAGLIRQLQSQAGPNAEALFIKDGQLKAGKAFLLSQSGPWNSGLKLTIDRQDPWYLEFLNRVGLLGAAGLTTEELLRAYSQDSLEFGTGDAADDTPDLGSQAILQQHADDQAHEERKSQTSQKLAYVQQRSKATLTTTARALTTPSQKARTVAVAYGLTQSAGVAQFAGNNDNLRSAYDQKKATLQRLQTDPMALVEEMSHSLADIGDAAPGLHGKLVAQTYKVVAFLQGKLPGTIGASLMRPDGSPPSDTALRQFALYYSAATNPSSVLTDLANNRARKEQIETLKELWPETYQGLKMSVLEHLSEPASRPTLAQRSRLDLLFDFGESLDKSLSSRLVQARMAYLAEQPEKPQGGAMPTRGSNPSIRGSDPLARLSTGTAAA